MNINFRKGFFRIWVVLSIIWAGVAGWLNFTDANKEASHLADIAHFERAYELELHSRSGEISERKKEVYEEAVRRGIVPKISFARDLLDKDLQLSSLDEQLRMSVVQVKYLGENREFPAGANPDQIWKSYEHVIRNKMIQIYFKAAGWMIIPPLAILLLGLIIAWVFRGFATAERDA
jgi:hypothetical protein